MQTKTVARWLGVGFAALLLSCEQDQAIAPNPLRPVVIHVVEHPVDTVTRSFSGKIEAAEGVDLGFEIAGRIVAISARGGERHHAGEELARLDDTGYRADLNNAQAQYVAANSSLQRTLRLFESQNASKSQLDSVMAQRETAKANLDIARKRLRDCTMRMPYTGTIGRIIADRQQVVSAGQSVLTIQGEGGVVIQVGVPAEVVAAISVGQRGTVELSSEVGTHYEAVVREVSPQITDGATYPVKLALDSPGAGVREGMDGVVHLNLPARNGGVLLVPLASVGSDPDGSRYVYTVQVSEPGDRATVHRTVVRSGELRSGGMIEILRGLHAGQVVVSRGVNRLTDGQQVLAPQALQT